jgi:hypothetical protein
MARDKRVRKEKRLTWEEEQALLEERKAEQALRKARKRKQRLRLEGEEEE